MGLSIESFHHSNYTASVESVYSSVHHNPLFEDSEVYMDGDNGQKIEESVWLFFTALHLQTIIHIWIHPSLTHISQSSVSHVDGISVICRFSVLFFCFL